MDMVEFYILKVCAKTDSFRKVDRFSTECQLLLMHDASA
jgi:hypothetical protein